MKFSKLVISGTITLVAIIVVLSLGGIITLKFVDSKMRFSRENIIAVEDLTMQLQTAVLEARKDEKDFFLRKDPKYLPRFDKDIKKIKGILGQMDSISSNHLDIFGVVLNVDDSLKTAIDVYDSLFHVVYDATVVIGLNEKEGLQGSFRNSAHGLMADFDSLNLRSYLPNIGELGLQIRRSEKDYLLRGKQKYVDLVHQKIEILEQEVRNSSMPEEYKQEVLKKSEIYKKEFDELVAQNKEIDRNISDFRDAIHSAEPLVDNVATTCDNVLLSQQKSMDKVIGTIITLFILFVIVAILFSLLLLRKIIFELKNKLGAEPSVIVDIAKELALGNINIDLNQYDSFGEFGVFSEMKKLVEAMKQSVNVAEKIAEGDISERVDPMSDKDVLGTAMEQMVTSLNRVTSGIIAGSNQIEESANQVSDASQALAETATNQAATIEELSSSMLEIKTEAEINAEKANELKKVASDTVDIAKDGTMSMAELKTTMDEVVDSSNQVVKIIKVIDDIAFQTNLLALNAAVEAARAGQHGKGFAVVADEVRNLAARSAKAAKETADLINASNKGAQNSAEMTAKTAEVFDDIVKRFSAVGDDIDTIRDIAESQRGAVKEINDALENLSTSIQNTSATSEETAATSEEMNSQAMELKKLVGFFKVSKGANNGNYNEIESISYASSESRLNALPNKGSRNNSTSDDNDSYGNDENSNDSFTSTVKSVDDEPLEY